MICCQHDWKESLNILMWNKYFDGFKRPCPPIKGHTGHPYGYSVCDDDDWTVCDGVQPAGYQTEEFCHSMSHWPLGCYVYALAHSRPNVGSIAFHKYNHLNTPTEEFVSYPVQTNGYILVTRSSSNYNVTY